MRNGTFSLRGSPVFSFCRGVFAQWIEALQGRYPQASFALGLPGHYSQDDLPLHDFPPLGVALFFGATSVLLKEADCVVAVPGSNNLEIVYRKKKGVVVFPLVSAVQDLPVTGFLNIVEKFPYWGKMIKRGFLLRALRRRKWLSLPNIVWNREILPELVGEISVERFLETIEKVLHGTEEHITLGLIAGDASSSLAGMIEEVLCEKVPQ